METSESKSSRSWWSFSNQQKWYEGDLLLACGWIFGKWAEKDELELAGTAKTPSARADHLQRANTMGLASNVSFGVLAYRTFQQHPKATTVLGVAWLGLNAFFSAASVPPKSSPFLHGLLGDEGRFQRREVTRIPTPLQGYSDQPPIATGWESWEYHPPHHEGRWGGGW